MGLPYSVASKNLFEQKKMKHLVPILFVLLVAASTIVRAAPVSYNTTTLLQLNGKGLEGVVYAPDGNIYYTLSDDHAIYKFVKGGPSVLIAGTAGSSGFSGDGGLATSAKLSHPMSPSFGANGDLYFADRGNGRIRKINATSGVISTWLERVVPIVRIMWLRREVWPRGRVFPV